MLLEQLQALLVAAHGLVEVGLCVLYIPQLEAPLARAGAGLLFGGAGVALVQAVVHSSPGEIA